MDEAAVSTLLALPAELIYHILAFLPPASLAAFSATSRLSRHHALYEGIWQRLVNDNIAEPLSSSSPLPSFRDLFIAHYEHWFLPRHRLWFADSEPNGKLLLARYDPRRGCIEAYAVVAERGEHRSEHWKHDANVSIHSFNPRVQLDLNQPVLKLDVGSPRTEIRAPPKPQALGMSNWFRPSRLFGEEDVSSSQEPMPRLSREILMDCSAPAGLYTSFMFARDHPADITGPGTPVWPPLSIPALSRTRNLSSDCFLSSGHRPKTITEVSQNTFRLRKWIEFSNRHAISTMLVGENNEDDNSYLQMGIPRSMLGQSVRMGEDVATYATLPSWCYTPTKEKPWQGIWCGDYSGHGCEFIVVLQPDEGDEMPLPDGMRWMHEWLTTGVRRRESSSTYDNHMNAELRAILDGRRHSVFDFDEDAEADEQDNVDSVNISPPSPTISSDRPDRTTNDDNADVPDSSPAAPSFNPNSVYSGRIEAVKLTGDPNIPRGQHTFIAPDIGNRGFVRVASESPFEGARVVRSAGHIAGGGFVHDEFVPSQLMLISPDRMAQYWMYFGHVSYYRRVNVEELLRL
ncbi:hypothetical protein AAFC00_000559 [Neodothiora populina]|uniref:F-box domain-containing protein n=1 Tax=Neodothiora populina TaxID=2781224 RepID=A0ABR3PEG0_9PEZI